MKESRNQNIKLSDLDHQYLLDYTLFSASAPNQPPNQYDTEAWLYLISYPYLFSEEKYRHLV